MPGWLVVSSKTPGLPAQGFQCCHISVDTHSTPAHVGYIQSTKGSTNTGLGSIRGVARLLVNEPGIGVLFPGVRLGSSREGSDIATNYPQIRRTRT
jgi:hypothetical protein